MAAVEAKRAGRCGVCQQPIEEGDRIVCVDDEWVHEECEEEA
jgi:hypothetical protein